MRLGVIHGNVIFLFELQRHVTSCLANSLPNELVTSLVRSRKVPAARGGAVLYSLHLQVMSMPCC